MTIELYECHLLAHGDDPSERAGTERLAVPARTILYEPNPLPGLESA
ncbi:MAG: hypothetical protein AAGB51_07055 [Planctomycetota bacterium]